MTIPGFMLYADLEKPLSSLSDSQLGSLIKAIYRYRFHDEAPDFSSDPMIDMAWDFMQPRLDADLERYEKRVEQSRSAARNSAEKRKAALGMYTAVNDMPQNKTSVDDTQRPSATVNDRQPTITITPTITSTITPTITKNKTAQDKEREKTPAPVRHKYGRYNNVLLSDEEMKKLQEELPDWEARIERLSEYMASKGVAYKSHLATIRAWARKDGGSCASAAGKRDVDADELAAIREFMGN